MEAKLSQLGAEATPPPCLLLAHVRMKEINSNNGRSLSLESTPSIHCVPGSSCTQASGERAGLWCWRAGGLWAYNTDACDRLCFPNVCNIGYIAQGDVLLLRFNFLLMQAPKIHYSFFCHYFLAGGLQENNDNYKIMAAPPQPLLFVNKLSIYKG